MKKIFLLTTLLYAACWQAEAQYVSKAWVSDQKDGTYINPVLHADYSDPDVCAAGEDFYMTASSFGCAPGLPILHSKDLVNWKYVGYALKQIEPPSSSSMLPSMEKVFGHHPSAIIMESFISIGEIRIMASSW